MAGQSFDKLELWFTGLSSSGNVRIDSFNMTYELVASDQPLTFEVTATDADGDTVPASFDVLLQGGSGPDYTVTGGAESDVLTGGSGSDTFTGGLVLGGPDSDTFVWKPGDAGNDVVTYFNLNAPASGGDVLDLSDLLVGEENAIDLSGYLSLTPSGSDTVINVDPTGTFTPTQSITLEGVSLADLAAYTEQTGALEIINQLIVNGNLKVDS